MIRALAAVILLALPAQALAQLPKRSLAVWDTGKTSAEPLAHAALAAKQGWTALEKDTPAIKGDAVISNGQLTAVVRRNGSIATALRTSGRSSASKSRLIAASGDTIAKTKNCALVEVTKG